jgi:glutamyl-tRNA synthetase
MSNDQQSGIRVRFAPSPTGYLHVGGARTALFNWLFARGRGGVFLLRIEDTDRQRSSEAMTRAILDGMTWLGLDWDEGLLHQADGVERHRADVARLLDSGAAYRCFCSQEELERRRAEAGGSAHEFRYDRRCADIAPDQAAARAAAGEPHTVRFRVPDGTTAWDDAVYDTIRFSNADIEDFIILRTDGTPIYNLAVVSDDVAMRITHVLRGDDHVSNTPKQILLYQALGAPVPVFGHLPMILGPDGKRLSKRHGATAVGDYREQGILAEAMTNFLALLGWNPGTEEEVFTMPELIQRFSLEGIGRKSAIFDPARLDWMNGQHINRRSAQELEPLVLDAFRRAGVPDPRPARGSDWFHALIDAMKVRARRIDDIAAQARPYVSDDFAYDPAARAKHWKDADVPQRLEAVGQVLRQAPGWEPDVLEAEVRACAERLGVGAARLIHPLRVAVIGQAVSPSIFQVLQLLGRDEVLRRIERARAELQRAADADA